jgi:hypothetical protein
MRGSYSQGIDSIDIFFSPAKALQRMRGVRREYGELAGLKDRTFQSVREVWAAAVFLLGYSQITKQEYWLRENPIQNDAPDVFAITPKPAEKGASREVLEIEVKEYDENAQTGLVEHLQRLIKDKAYHPETFLLCYVHAPGRSVRLIDVIDGLKGIRTTIREVWLLLNLEGQEPGHFLIARVFLRGEESLEKLNLQYSGSWLELEQIPQKEMIKPSFGLSDGVEFTPLGVGYVPLPKPKAS